MARSLLSEMEAEGRLRSACDLLRHVFGVEIVEEEMEEVRRRAGRTTGLIGESAVARLANGPAEYFAVTVPLKTNILSNALIFWHSVFIVIV
jgi:hypothetical protein